MRNACLEERFSHIFATDTTKVCLAGYWAYFGIVSVFLHIITAPIHVLHATCSIIMGYVLATNITQICRLCCRRAFFCGFFRAIT